MPLVVLDTNVVLDWLVFGDARISALTQAIQGGDLRWLATTPMREEFAHMLAHKSLARWTPDPPHALQFFDDWVQRCDAAPSCGLRCRDPDDQGFIDLALFAGASWLMTRDKALLRLARPAALRGTQICQPDRYPKVFLGLAVPP